MAVAAGVAVGAAVGVAVVGRRLGEQWLLDRIRHRRPDLLRPGRARLGSVRGYGGYGYPSYYSGYGVYDYFPTWGVSNYSSWGLGSMANNWLYSGYTNPYYSTVVAAQPAQTTVVYDYSQPINVVADAPDPAAASSTEQVFSAARDAFKAGDYQRALDLTDQVLKDTPNVPAVHEFRALCLFALKRFDESAAVDYAVLSAGPGMNWTTLVGLYPDVDTYTNQLRALEASVRSNPNAASTEFLLGYHYLVQGHQDECGEPVREGHEAPARRPALGLVRQGPEEGRRAARGRSRTGERRRGRAARGCGPGDEPRPGTACDPAAQPTVAAAEQPQQQEPEAPPPPPASLVGTWKAQPSPDLTISLTLQADGQFAWEVDTKGQKQTLTGQAGFKDNTLALLQEEGPPLVGKIAEEGGNKFTFSPPSGAQREDAWLDVHQVLTNWIQRRLRTLCNGGATSPTRHVAPPVCCRPRQGSLRMGGRQDLAVAEPLLAPLGPGGAGMLARSKAEAMAARIVDVQLGRDLGVLRAPGTSPGCSGSRPGRRRHGPGTWGASSRRRERSGWIRHPSCPCRRGRSAPRSPGGSSPCPRRRSADRRARRNGSQVQAVRCPPAEKPSMPIRFGSIPHSPALLRTRLTARWASISACTGGRSRGVPSRRGTRYFRTTPVTPIELSQAATSSPSRSHARML